MKYTAEQEKAIVVRFAFRKRNYYRIKRETGEEIGEVRGEKSLRMFKSWFNLMLSKGRLLCGVLEFLDSGDMWIWQPPVETSRGWMGGWQKALDGKHRIDYKPERDGLYVPQALLGDCTGIGNATAGNISE